jgi:hypothetical protein
MMDSIEVIKGLDGSRGIGDVVEGVSVEDEESEWDSERSGTEIESDDDNDDDVL